MTTVAMRTLAAATVSVALVALAAASAPAATPAGHPLADTIHECLEPIPEAAGASGVTDSGQTVRLEVFLLLDGITTARADEVMDRAAETYAPLDVELVVTASRKLRIPGDPPRPNGTRPSAEAFDLFHAMKDAMNGERPSGSDVVHLLTAKDVYLVSDGQPSYGLAGVADCIGGVRYPEHAFSFSEGVGEWDEVRDDMAGVIAAHELGHLMGAHHHYGNCAEGAPIFQETQTPCTVMWPFFISMNAGNFGTLEGAVVRGHAVDYAAP